MTPTVIGPMDSHTKLILTLIASSALVGVAGAQIHCAARQDPMRTPAPDWRWHATRVWPFTGTGV